MPASAATNDTLASAPLSTGAILPSDFLPVPRLGASATQRRRELMAHRRARGMALGPAMRLQFEDELTVRHQIREVLRAGRITDPGAIRHEIDTYAHLLPDGTQWKATLLIQFPDATERARSLPLLSAAAHRIYVECPGLPRVQAHANEDLQDRHLARPSGVHFLRFELPEALRLRVIDGSPAAIGCAHHDYHWRRVIPSAALRLLRCDLTRAARHAEFAGSTG